MSSMNITILGDGAMATTCAMILDSQGQTVTLWSPFSEHLHAMAGDLENKKYLPGIPLPDSFRYTSEPDEALQDAQLIVSAVPTQFVRRTWEQFAAHVNQPVEIVSVAKGIEKQNLLLPTQIIADVIGEDRIGRIAALSGPSIAGELARCLPATICSASTDMDFARRVQELFTTSWLRVYTNPDRLGVELAGATKNVIALAAGMLDGLQAGYNAKSALLSRGLAEIARLGTAMNAHHETFFGVTGVGDLAVTCFSPVGRNRSAGEMLGKGMSLDEVLEKIDGVVEGVPTTEAVMALAGQHAVEMPITAAIHSVLFDNLDPLRAISLLMKREPKQESV